MTSAATEGAAAPMAPHRPAAERPVGVDLQETEQNRGRDRGDRGRQPRLHGAPHARPGAGAGPGRLVISRESVEARLGRPWETHEFQLAIISYFGNIAEWDDDQIVIAWEH